MKKAVYLLTCYFLLTLSFSLMAQQQGNNSSNNYWYINQKFTDYYEDIIATQGQERLNDYGFKNYYRWNNYWYTRLGEDGDMQSIIDATTQYFESATTPVNNNLWEIIGPVGLPLSNTGLHRFSIGKGMVISLWVNPENNLEIFAGTHTAGLWYTNDGGNIWESKTDDYFEIQGVYQIVQHPDNENTFYILSANTLSKSSYGVFKSTDRGETWDDFPIELSNYNIYPTASPKYFPKKLIFHPDNANIMFLITQSLILKSVDGGLNWEEKYNGNFNYWGMSAALIDSLCNGDYNCILALEQQEHGFNNIIFDQTNPQNIFVSGHIMLKSEDNGDTWTNITQDVTGRIREWDMLTNINENYPDYIWIYSSMMSTTGTSADSSFLLKYNLNSGNAEELFFDEEGGRNLIRVSPSDPNNIYLAGQFMNTLHVYNQISNTITQIFSLEFTDPDFLHVDCRDLIAYENSDGNDSLFIACDGGVSAGKKIVPNANNWEYTDLSTLDSSNWLHHLNITEFYAIDGDESDGEFLIGNTQDLGGFLMESANWLHTGFGDGGGIEIDKTNPNFIYYADYQGRIGRSNNKGRSFFNIGSIGVLDANPRVPLALDPDNADHLFLGTRGLRRYNKCRSDLINYDPITFPYDSNQIITAIEFSESNTNILYVGTKKQYNSWDENSGDPNLYTGCVWKSPDKGTTWIDISSGFGGAYQGFVTDICINPFNSNEIWVALAGATTYDSNQFLSKKIYHSLDGGLNYNTYVEGLPDIIPVNKIRYDKINHHLYIVTDVGVFTRDLFNGNGWEDFNDGLPRKMVNDIYLNLQDQKIVAATYGRGIWKTDLKQIADCPAYTSVPLYIETDTVWDKPMLINSDVIIESGNTLTIRSVSYFHHQSRVIVKPGAELFIDNGVLTNSCDSTTWQGIQVWGNSSAGQNISQQGWLHVYNGTIENAVRAIVANSYYIPDAARQDNTGGIIQAYNSLFKNNLTAAQFDAYDSYSASRFYNCSFITDDDYPFQTNPNAFVDIYSHKGTYFSDCSFKNEESSTPDTLRGIGIRSTNGGFSVWQSSFSKLYYGIYGLGTLAQNSFSIRYTDFSCYRGIYMGAYHNNYISQSTFAIPASLPGLNNNAYGIYMQNSTGYCIEDNYFSAKYGNIDMGEVGLYINNSGTDDNEIYRNSFFRLQFGIIAQDINRNGNIGGLCIRCNTFSNTTSDIAVTSEIPFPGSNHGIAKNQGVNSTNPALMAGNIFYYNTIPNDFDDINNELNTIDYYYPTNVVGGFGNTDPEDFTTETVTKFGKQVFYNWSYTNGCPPREGGEDIELLRSIMTTSAQQSDSVSAILAVLVDGGNTAELTDEVDQSTPPETVELYNDLIAKSPYLSDSVVESAIIKENVLPNAMLRDIMVANTHSAKSEALITTLDNRWNPMPDYMKAQILQGRSLVSLKEETESHLCFFNLNKARAFYGLTRYFINDTINPAASADSLATLLASGTTISSYYKLALLHFDKGEYTLGSNVLTDISVNFMLNAGEAAEYQNMVNYYNWLVEVEQSEDNIMYPDSTQLQQLWDIVDANSSIVGVYARNMLVALGKTMYTEPIIVPDLYKSTQAETEFIELLNTKTPNIIKVFPNPASDYVILEYKLETDVKASIIIQDLRGINIKEYKTKSQQDQITVITKDWVSGIYIVSLRVDGKLTESTKFTVVK
jgi:hypothetical protein